MPNNNSFVSMDEAERYYEQLLSLRRPSNITVRTQDAHVIEHAKHMFTKGEPAHFKWPGMRDAIYGFVTSILPYAETNGTRSVTITIRPTAVPKSLGPDEWWDAKYLASGEAHIHFNKERVMKVFEAVVVKINEQGEATEVAKVVTPFVAKNVEDAKSIVRVDYARENDLNGKDATAIQVRVREFPV